MIKCKIILGYALFDENGVFVWAYSSKGKALAHTEDYRLIAPVGYDTETSELFIVPHKDVREDLYYDQFWCLTHDYWMDKLREDL